MQILVNSNNSINSTANLANWASAEIEDTLGRFADRITRVEVFLNDMNQDKNGGNDKRCSIEAKFEGLPPVVASHDAESLGEALGGAARKLEKVLDRKIGRIDHKKGRMPMGGETFAALSGGDTTDDDLLDIDVADDARKAGDLH